MSKRKTHTDDIGQTKKDEEAIQYLIASRNEMVKALKKVLDRMDKRRNQNANHNRE